MKVQLLERNTPISIEFCVLVLFYDFGWVLDYNPDIFRSQTSCRSPLHPDPALIDTAGGLSGLHDERTIHDCENNAIIRNSELR